MGRITVTVTGTLPDDPYLYQPDPETPIMCCVPLVLHHVDFDPAEAYVEVSSYAARPSRTPSCSARATP
jgi:hypothetical protein